MENPHLLAANRWGSYHINAAIACVVLLLSSCTSSSSTDLPKKIIGEWRYEVPIRQNKIAIGRYGNSIFNFRTDGLLILEDIDTGKLQTLSYRFIDRDTIQVESYTKRPIDLEWGLSIPNGEITYLHAPNGNDRFASLLDISITDDEILTYYARFADEPHYLSWKSHPMVRLNDRSEDVLSQNKNSVGIKAVLEKIWYVLVAMAPLLFFFRKIFQYHSEIN